MGRGNIYMLQSNPDFVVLTDQIFARNDSKGSTLFIPFKIEFSGTPGGSNYRMSKAEVLFFKGELRTKDSSILCGESIVFANNTLSTQQKTLQSQFQFSFSYEITNAIEKHRHGDLPMNISVTAQTAEYEEIIFASRESRSFVTGFDKASGHVDFRIPQSNWVKDLLPQMGHQSFRLIEVPTASQIIPTGYTAALHELEQAKSFFLHGYYDKVASHCRVALEPFKKQLPELRNAIESESEFEWMKALSAGTFDWLDKILKTTYAITSKAHHPPSTGHFSRLDAEIIMMVTTAVIAFVGNVRR